MLEESIEQYLRIAIEKTVRHDSFLLSDRRTHERSIMFRVGLQLAALVEVQGEDWKVDVEYNRMGDPSSRVSKRVELLKRSPQDRARSVFPDLIVHKRGETLDASNLLVVEAKKELCTGTASDYDKQKLLVYLEELNYRHAAFLILGMGPSWDWFCESMRGCNHADL